MRKIGDYIVTALLLCIAFLCLLLLLGKRKSVALTDHAIMRMKERMGIRNEDKMQRLANKAYRQGKRARQLPKKMATLMREKQKKYGNSIIAVYKGFIYVFSKDRVLITVYKNDYI